MMGRSDDGLAALESRVRDDKASDIGMYQRVISTTKQQIDGDYRIAAPSGGAAVLAVRLGGESVLGGRWVGMVIGALGSTRAVVFASVRKGTVLPSTAG